MLVSDEMIVVVISCCCCSLLYEDGDEGEDDGVIVAVVAIAKGVCTNASGTTARSSNAIAVIALPVVLVR